VDTHINDSLDEFERRWPTFVRDRDGRLIYITEERWQHALDHPGMSDELLDVVLKTLRTSKRKQDKYEPAKYSKPFADLPFDYTHVVVVVKFGVSPADPGQANNFVLTAYLVEKFSITGDPL